MNKNFLQTFSWPLPVLSEVEGFRDCDTFPPEDGPAGFVAGRGHGFGLSGIGGRVAVGAYND